MQVCSRRPPPASPRASRKFASSEVSESESCGSDVSDKLSLLGSAAQTADRSGDKGTPVLVGGSNSSRGKTCASSASAAAKKTSAKKDRPKFKPKLKGTNFALVEVEIIPVFKTIRKFGSNN